MVSKSTPMMYFIIIVIFLSSCVSQNKLKYLLDEEMRTQFDNPFEVEYRIQPNDNLFLQVLGLDSQTAQLFSMQPGTDNRQNINNELSVYLNSYTVNAAGYIELPVIGPVFVKDKTLDEIKVLLQEAINEYMRDATVIVKLVNFHIYVIGEVKRPGRNPVFHSRVTLFEALAMAGDMAEWGDRKNVQLVRKNLQGSEVHILDMSQRTILQSEFYYLMPDDVIYVPPMKAKTWAFTEFPYMLLFSTVTTTLLILQYFK